MSNQSDSANPTPDGQEMPPEHARSTDRPPDRPPSSWRRRMIDILPPTCLILLIGLWNLGFIVRDHADYAGVDDADSYMDYAGIYADWFSDGIDLSDFRRIGFDVYSPLNYILGGLTLTFAEAAPRALRLYSASYLLFALFYVYWLARLFFGKDGALLAVFFGGLNLHSLLASRYFTLDAPLVLPMAAGLYHAIQSRGFIRVRHTIAALAFAAFGVAIKLAFAAQIFPSFALIALYGLATLIREKRWGRLALTIAIQCGLCASVVALVFAINPHVANYLALGTGNRPSGNGFVFSTPFHTTGPNTIRAMAFWFLGYLWALRRIAWPLAALSLIGAVAGLAFLRPWSRKIGFLAVLLVPFSTNILYVWVNAHYDLDRYMGPSFVFFGIAVVAATLLAPDKRPRRAALACLALYGIVAWTGPRLWRAAFDCRKGCLLPGLRIEGQWLKSGRPGQYPLIQTKLWSEPAPRPDRTNSAARLMRALRDDAADKVSSPTLKVAYVGTDYWEDDSFFEYERLVVKGDPFKFVFSSNPSSLLDADYIVLLSGSYAPGYTHELDAANYRAMLCVLESESQRKRLRCRELLRMGLRRGDILMLFERSRPATDAEALEDAVVWQEAIGFYSATRTKPEEAAGWLRQSGNPEAARAMDALGSGPPAGESDSSLEMAFPPALCPGYARLKAWLATSAEPDIQPLFEEIFASGPAPGPGLALSMGVEALRWSQPEIALQMFRHSMEEFPCYPETWTTALALIPYGLTLPMELAQDGRSLAQLYDRYGRTGSYDVRLEFNSAARRLANLGFPAFWERQRKRLELLERDAPYSLAAQTEKAAQLESAGDYGPELVEKLKTAYAWNGQERLDYELRHAMGRCLLQLDRVEEAEGHLWQGGWEGVRTWLKWLRLQGDEAAYHTALAAAEKKIFPDEMEGSDEVRAETICALAGQAPADAQRAFAQMNQTTLAQSWSLFSQLASSYNESRLQAFQNILRRGRVNFYSPTRPDFFALAVSECLTGEFQPPAWNEGEFSAEEIRFRTNLERGRNLLKSNPPFSTIAELSPGERKALLEIACPEDNGVVYGRVRFLVPKGSAPMELSLALEAQNAFGFWQNMEAVPLISAEDEKITAEILADSPANCQRFRLMIGRAGLEDWMPERLANLAASSRLRFAAPEIGLCAFPAE